MLRGVVLYRGASVLTGEEIVCVATLSSENAKTGPMIQTWILAADESPTEAINSGADRAVCGDCPLRGLLVGGRNVMRGCYVSVRNAPYQVWHAWHRGLYPDYSPAEHRELFRGRMLRLGSYGDPVAVPLRAWRRVLMLAGGWTGYTHAWRRCSPRWQRYVMASCESASGAALARARGWRSFRVRLDHDPLLADEIICPASPEGGQRMTCEQCGACDGGRVAKRSVAIVGHGARTTLSSLLRVMAG